jgi:hypothetical protein
MREPTETRMLTAAKLGPPSVPGVSEHGLGWSATLAARPVFAEGGYRLYRLP